MTNISTRLIEPALRRSSVFSKRLGMALLLGMVSLPAAALSPEIEADRLILATRTYLEQGNVSRATQSLEKMEQLKTDLPVEYFFFKGQVAWHGKESEAARSALEDYVQKAGREGEHYQQALVLLTEIEEVGAEPATPASAGEAAIQWQRQGVHSDEYVEKLRKLYLKDQAKDALVEHINSLLATKPFRPSRLVTPEQRDGLRYSVSLGGQGVLLVQETRYDNAGNAQVNLERRDVFGIDPYVRFGCDQQRRACWIYDPQNQHREWLVLGDDQQVAEDLSKAVTKLLLTLQNPV